MELFCYQAECGDAVRIRYIGNDGNPHNIFLDSGYERTYGNILRQEIKKLIQAGEIIDLWIVSHIHDDHIGGLMKYIRSVDKEEIQNVVKEWYYNPPRNWTAKFVVKQENNSFAMSIKQSDRFYNFLKRNNKLPKKDITSDLGIQEFFGMKIHILSPTTTILSELRDKYKTEIPFQSNEIDEISTAKAIFQNDYDKKIEEFNLDKFFEDISLENRSSISVLFEYQNRTILWLADSHPSVVSASLIRKGYSKNNPLICDYVILSHHASKGNNNTSLFNLIECCNYIISSNGENKHRLPNKEVLARIIRHKNRDFSKLYSLWFTYDTYNLRDIFNSDGVDADQEWNLKLIYSNSSFLYLEL